MSLARIAATSFFIWPIYTEVNIHIKMKQSGSSLKTSITFMNKGKLEQSVNYDENLNGERKTKKRKI